MTEWTEMRSTEKPAEIFQIAPDLYMQTRNAEEVTDEGADGNSSTGWKCEAREVTDSELRLLNQITELESYATDTDLALAELAELIGGE